MTEMKENSGRLILKVKKKRNSLLPVSKKDESIFKGKDHNSENAKGRKRSNPFVTSVLGNKKSNVLTPNGKSNGRICIKSPNDKRSCKLLRQLDLAESRNSHENEIYRQTKIFEPFGNVLVNAATECKNGELALDSAEHIKDTECTKYSNSYPIDWRLKEKMKFVSSQSFSAIVNVKSLEESEGIRNYVRSNSSVKLHQNLYYWAHPSIPGVPQFPLKKRIPGLTVKEEKNVNILSNNKQFQDVVMMNWRNSFQSIFTMLRTGYCPYFYFSSYQMTVLFKSAVINEEGLAAIVTPTTKGFRKMLTDEGISFTLPRQKSDDRMTFSDEPDDENEDINEFKNEDELNTSNEEDFLSSIGLDKKHHFPHMEEQKRLQEKARTRLLDNRVESTIVIKNCVGFFNFLLNSSYLCAPSGVMIGVPPTLISPSPFEGATLQKCKVSHGPVKIQMDGHTHTNYCLEVSGVILPTQTEGIIRTVQFCNHRAVTIQSKHYINLEGLNTGGGTSHVAMECECQKLGISSTAMSYMKQTPLTNYPLRDEMVIENDVFRYRI